WQSLLRKSEPERDRHQFAAPIRSALDRSARHAVNFSGSIPTAPDRTSVGPAIAPDLPGKAADRSQRVNHLFLLPGPQQSEPQSLSRLPAVVCLQSPAMKSCQTREFEPARPSFGLPSLEHS